MVKHDDVIGGCERRETVCDDDRGLLPVAVTHRFQNQAFGPRVDGAQGIVEDKNIWLLKQSASDRNTLPLPTRKCHAPLANNGLVALIKFKDRVVNACHPRSKMHLFLGRAATRQGDIVVNRPRVQEWVLHDDRHSAAMGLAVKRRDVYAINTHNTIVWIVETQQQVDDRALAAA